MDGGEECSVDKQDLSLGTGPSQYATHHASASCRPAMSVIPKLAESIMLSESFVRKLGCMRVESAGQQKL